MAARPPAVERFACGTLHISGRYRPDLDAHGPFTCGAPHISSRYRPDLCQNATLSGREDGPSRPGGLAAKFDLARPVRGVVD